MSTKTATSESGTLSNIIERINALRSDLDDLAREAFDRFRSYDDSDQEPDKATEAHARGSTFFEQVEALEEIENLLTELL